MSQSPMFAPKRIHGQRGFSLVELMVSLVISMLVCLAAVAGAQFYMKMQRQSMGMENAGANSALALASVKSEVAQAGLGFYDRGAFACPQFNLSKNTNPVFNGTTVVPVSITTTDMRPTLNVLYATALEAAGSTTLVDPATNQDTSIKIATYLNAQPGQTVLVAPASGVTAPCSLKTVTAVTASAGTGQTLQMDNTGALNQYGFTSVSYAAGDSVMLLGALKQTSFSLTAAGDFVMARPLEGGSAVLAKNVVASVIQYGVTETGGTSLAGWRYPVAYPSLASGGEDWTTATPLQMSLIRAIRISMIIRSDQKEKPNVDGTCNTTESMPTLLGTQLGTVVADDGIAANTKVSKALTGDWQCYRYREVSIVAPLRNLVWGVNT